MEKPPTRLALVVGLVLIAAGWGVIYYAWNKAAQLDLETGQLPYVLSGGFGGLGLLVLGGVGIVVDVILRTQWQSREALRDLRPGIERERPEPRPTAVGGDEDEGSEETREGRRRRRGRAGSG